MAENPEDINFPLSTVARIIKEAVSVIILPIIIICFIISSIKLPEGVIVSKEAKGAIGRAASVFVLYATTW